MRERKRERQRDRQRDRETERERERERKRAGLIVLEGEEKIVPVNVLDY